MIFVVLIIIILIYIFSIPKVRKAKFGRFVSMVLRMTIFIMTPLLVTLLVAETYNIYPKQYWVSKTVFWIVIFSCMASYGLCNKDYFANFERAIYGVIFFLPLLFVPLLLVPFIGIGVGLIFYVKFIGDDKFVLYSDNKIRIEQPSIRFMGPDPSPVIFIKKGLTAYKDTIMLFEYNEMKDEIQVQRETDSTYLIKLISPDNWQVPAGELTVRYRLKK